MHFLVLNKCTKYFPKKKLYKKLYKKKGMKLVQKKKCTKYCQKKRHEISAMNFSSIVYKILFKKNKARE